MKSPGYKYIISCFLILKHVAIKETSVKWDLSDLLLNSVSGPLICFGISWMWLVQTDSTNMADVSENFQNLYNISVSLGWTYNNQHKHLDIKGHHAPGCVETKPIFRHRHVIMFARRFLRNKICASEAFHPNVWVCYSTEDRITKKFQDRRLLRRPRGNTRITSDVCEVWWWIFQHFPYKLSIATAKQASTVWGDKQDRKHWGGTYSAEWTWHPATWSLRTQRSSRSGRTGPLPWCWRTPPGRWASWLCIWGYGAACPGSAWRWPE